MFDPVPTPVWIEIGSELMSPKHLRKKSHKNATDIYKYETATFDFTF